MPEALPVLYRLVHQNLGELSLAVQEQGLRDPQGRLELLCDQMGWLHALVDHMASMNTFTVSTKIAGQDTKREKGPPFVNPGLLVDLIPNKYTKNAFAQQLAWGFTKLRAAVPVDSAKSTERLSWLARQMAGAALMAYIRLLPIGANDECIVVLDAPLGETVTAVEATIVTLLHSLSPSALTQMPLYLAAVEEASGVTIEQLRQAIKRLAAADLTAGEQRSVEATVSHLGLYFTALYGKRLMGPAKSTADRRERMIKVLRHLKIIESDDDAEKIVVATGVKDGSKGAIAVEACRGKHRANVNWADACQKRGVLTAQLIETHIEAPKLRTELIERLQTRPEGLIDLALPDLAPSDLQPNRTE